MLVRQRVRTYLDVIHRADSRFRELGQVRAISRPNAAALPARLGVVNPAIQAARVERHRIGHTEYGERFFLRIEDQHRVRSCPGDNHRIFAESESIELINPKEVGVFGAACFVACARELWSRQVPVLECPSFGIQASEVPAAAL